MLPAAEQIALFRDVFLGGRRTEWLTFTVVLGPCKCLADTGKFLQICCVIPNALCERVYEWKRPSFS